MDKSEKAYLLRVRTYTPDRWFCKPTAVSPLQMALWGWRCVGADMLECKCCGAMLCVALDPRLEGTMLANACERFLSQASSRHAKNCMWQGAPCPSEFTRLPSACASRAVRVESRARGLARLEADLKGKICISPPSLQRVRAVLDKTSHAKPDGKASAKPTPTPSPTVIMAAFGWSWPSKLNRPAGAVYVECKGCMARCSIAVVHVKPSRKRPLCEPTVEAFSSKRPRLTRPSPPASPPNAIDTGAETPHLSPGSTTSLPTSSAPRPRSPKTTTDSCFDPFTQHRSFCPFMRTESSSESGAGAAGIPGWVSCIAAYQGHFRDVEVLGGDGDAKSAESISTDDAVVDAAAIDVAAALS